MLTTLHTNSAVAALTRLVDMGAEPFLVASSLTAAIAQRLVRKPVSTSCAEPYVPDEVTLTGLGLTAGGPGRRTPRARRRLPGVRRAPGTAAGPPSTRCSSWTPRCARC